MSGSWIEIKINTTTEAVEAITNILFENGAQGAMIEDPKDFKFQKTHDYDWDYVDEDMLKHEDDSVYIKTYISEERDILSFIENIKLRINELTSFGLDIGKGSIETDKVKEDDWAHNWMKYYKPTKIGKNIVIKPEWEDYEADENDIILEMNPGMAFGTGNHETTSMCISNLEKYVKKDFTVYDIGCGSGILGITAAKLGAKQVLAIDIDAMAVKVAKENIEKNNVGDIVTAIVGNLADEIDKNKKADIIVANIIADIIIFLAKDVKTYLKNDGIFISSGIIHAKIDEVVQSLEKAGFEILEVEKKGEWACVIAK